MNKPPPVSARDSGGAFTIDNPDDGTPIREMFALGNGLLILSEQCTYRIQMADQIDPERINPSLPHNFQQKLFDQGTKSRLLCKTLLQAKTMFRKEFQTIDIEKAMHCALDALGNLISMDEIAEKFTADEKAAIAKAQKNRSKDASMTVPSVGNVRAECKSFSQKADHFAVSLMNIVRLFYPEMAGQNWKDLRDLAKARYGENDEFFKLLVPAATFLKFIRDARDCLEHANLEGAKTRDFEPEPNGTIAPPTIEIDFRQSVQDRCSISSFIRGVTQAMPDYFEMIVVHMCSKSIKPFAGMPLVVGELSQEVQNAWHVRFAYGSYDQGGQFIPCG